jgi:hypothetical protein
LIVFVSLPVLTGHLNVKAYIDNTHFKRDPPNLQTTAPQCFHMERSRIYTFPIMSSNCCQRISRFPSRPKTWNSDMPSCSGFCVYRIRTPALQLFYFWRGVNSELTPLLHWPLLGNVTPGFRTPPINHGLEMIYTYDQSRGLDSLEG